MARRVGHRVDPEDAQGLRADCILALAEAVPRGLGDQLHLVFYVAPSGLAPHKIDLLAAKVRRADIGFDKRDAVRQTLFRATAPAQLEHHARGIDPFHTSNFAEAHQCAHAGATGATQVHPGLPLGDFCALSQLHRRLETADANLLAH
jgi:hypothetical protein